MPGIDTSFLALRSRFIYGVVGGEIDWATDLPSRAWDRRTGTIGGQRISAAGTPAAYVVRRDHVILVPLRFYETEWEAVHALIRWGQSGESFIWYPDALDTVVSFEVYLDSPAAGEDIQPSRSTEYPHVLELTVGLRGVLDLPWNLDYFYG